MVNILTILYSTRKLTCLHLYGKLIRMGRENKFLITLELPMLETLLSIEV